LNRGYVVARRDQALHFHAGNSRATLQILLVVMMMTAKLPMMQPVMMLLETMLLLI
jgi:uncharacterized membrane protein